MSRINRPIVTPELYVHAVENGDDELADHYAQQLEEPRIAEDGWYERPEALHLSALHYVTTYGLEVLPLAPGSKVPIGGGCCDGLHRRGVTDALSDPLAVGDVWRAHPRANIGIATGHVVDVIDQDGTAGAVSWLRLPLPPDVLGVVSTPRAGGVHRYIAASGSGNGARIAPGIDYRGRGGYVVAPPSVVEGRRYGWIVPLTLPRTR
jgi:hypothetical protein